MVERLAPYWSSSRVRDALHLDDDGLAARCADGKLLCLPISNGEGLFPILQFAKYPDGTVGTRAGVVAFVSALHGKLEPWTIGLLLRLPADELDDMTPERWIAEGRSRADLLEYAAIVAAEMRR